MSRGREFVYTLGDNLDGADVPYLLDLARHLRVLAGVVQATAVAYDLRSTGHIEAALVTEKTREDLISQLPSNWRW